MQYWQQQKKIFQETWQLFKRDRAAKIFSAIALLFIALILVLISRVGRLNAQRNELTQLVDMVRVADIEKLQSRLFHIHEIFDMRGAALNPADLQMDIDVLEQQLFDIDQLPQDEELLRFVNAADHQFDANWLSQRQLFEEWLLKPQDALLEARIEAGFITLQADAGELLNAVGEFQVAVSDRLIEINRVSQRLLPITAATLLGIIISATVLINSLFRNRMLSNQEIELLAQFPQQNPFPVIRLNQDYSIVYANPASRMLDSAFAFEEGHVTDKVSRAWLDQAFESKKPLQMDVEANGKTYSMIATRLPEQKQVTVYAIDVTDRKQAEEEARTQVRRIQALRQIDSAITSSLPLEGTLDVALAQVSEMLAVDAASILVKSKKEPYLYTGSSSGFGTKDIKDYRVRLGKSLAGKVALERQALQIADLLKTDIPYNANLVEGEGFRSYFANPLIVDEKLVGVLETFMRRPYKASEDWLEYLNTLAGQAAIAIDNAQLREKLSFSNRELRQAYDSTLIGWAKALELRDEETQGHSRRVTQLTVLLAKKMGIGEKRLVHVRRGAILHDIGKMGVPDAILLKPGKLNEQEWEIMKKHTQYAHDWLWPIKYLRPALDIPYAHHERWDGSGYPRGLKGEKIPLAARIFAVVDVWDALRSDRPYRKAWTREKALDYILKGAGTQFCPRAVKNFMALMEENNI